MTDTPANPIPFNPEGLTLRQSKEALDTLRWIFDCLDRDVVDKDPENFIANLRGQRDGLIRRWSH